MTITAVVRLCHVQARGPHLKAMSDRGLRVHSPDGDFEVRPEVTGDLATLGPADVVVLGVKAHGLPQLAPQLRALFTPETVVVSTQNGIPWWSSWRGSS